ncbi:MAG TPA: hypothetical protein VGX48_24790 [Pyrinomonadaceae bacterium]|jgi:hypothetical protein|nr:hypothetical protein [Pyrinomonadaceae bacterium]
MNWRFLSEEGSAYLTNAVAVPRDVRLEGSEIVWNPQDSEVETKEVEKELLLDFANLVLFGAESILEFARSWGVLGLCEHGWPATHTACFIASSDGATNRECQPTGRETVEQWQAYARAVRSLLSIASKVRRGDIGRAEDWRVLGVESEGQPKEISSAESLLQNYANRLLDLANVRPRVQLNPAKIRISHPANSSFFGVLAVQVAQHVSGTNGPLICSSCGEFYEMTVLERRPRAGERNYCFMCRGTASRRDATRAYRMRLKEKQKES